MFANFIPTLRRTLFPALFLTCASFVVFASVARSDDEARDVLQRDFSVTVQPFLRKYCLDCHSSEDPEAKLDLSLYSSLDDIADSHQIWETVLKRLESEEMPPEDAAPLPTEAQSKSIIDWIRTFRNHEAQRNAGDPGVVLARRLSNAEFNNSIRDLTRVDIKPTKTFPVDPANAAGFDNTGESLTMSPALLKKYLEATRLVADHLVLTPTGLTFAPHPAVTDTDRDKFCVKRIVQFYNEQPTDLAEYFFTCWQYRETPPSIPEGSVLSEAMIDLLPMKAGISPKYTALVWELLNEKNAVGPIAKLQVMFQKLPHQAEEEVIRQGCNSMRDYVLNLRPKLTRKFENLKIDEVHKGSQSFVLWKNRQYASHRQVFDRGVLFTEGDEIPPKTPFEFVFPKNEEAASRYLESMERFCSVFPDAFYISERGRDYLGVAKEKQEKGRLLSAGFHSMMGYFRDDAPLCELILNDDQRQTLDRLWRELDYVASAPARQYVGFLWFERTDSRYMRDQVFDFARPEDKNAASEAMIAKLSEVYLEKAIRNGGSGEALQAIEDYFSNINTQIRWVESERLKSEPVHLDLLLQFAHRAWRRPLFDEEAKRVRAFYQSLRDDDGLSHEDAMRDSVVSILMSPHFLYRVDLVAVGEGSRRLSDFELNNRLSYFLWSSLPDKNSTFSYRTNGDETVNSQRLTALSQRMLRDERVRGLATEFAANWLDIRRFEEHNSVDRDRFPAFTDELRKAMFEEPIRFFIDLVQNDRSVLELIEADYTFVNPVLAKHYGIEGLDFSFSEWVRVDSANQFGRGGLLPMSVFLTKNSPGLRTSPVKRGYWVVRRLLGERIPPPPPNVPDLPEDESQLGDLSLPEILARHREHKSCAGCHDRFDAIGLAFEGFGPVGERRDVDLGGRTIESTAVFPDGEKRTGIEGLHQYFTEHRQQDFIENLCRKLLSYALGRSLVLSDEPLLAKMQMQLEIDDYRFSSLIESIVTSRQFLYKRGDKQLFEVNK